MANNTNKTYTYTARNSEDLNRVVTFTLYDGHMRVGLTGLLDQVQAVAGSEERSDELKRQAAIQVRPALLKIKEGLSGPIKVGDVDAKLNGDRLKVIMWPRLRGLRLAPVRINMGGIDNPDAAESFVDELEKRKETTDTRSFFGPLDYWFGWAGLLLLIGLFIRRTKNNNSSDETDETE